MIWKVLASMTVWTFVFVLAGGFAINTAFSSSAQDDMALRRDDEGNELVLVSDDDDDDDDSDDDDGDDSDSRSAYSSNVDSNDGTGSGYSAVSRDNDRSRDDRTRDWTRDGGDRTRDFSQNRTNDASRDDTR